MLQKCSTWRVLQVFFDDPDPDGLGLGLKEVSRRSNLSHTSVKRHLETLKNENLVETKEKKLGKRVYPVYSSRRDEDRFRHYKVIDMISRIRESGLLENLIKGTMPDCVILFGSAARGEDTKNSDVDFYLQCEEKEMDLSYFEESLKRKIQLHYNPEFSTYPAELKNNIVNGIVMYGYLTGYGD